MSGHENVGAYDYAGGLDEHGPERVVEKLFCDVVADAGDVSLARAFMRVNERLAPLQVLEARVFADVRAEATQLVQAQQFGDRPGLRAAVRRYHRRRSIGAVSLARLSDPRKYRPDIV